MARVSSHQTALSTAIRFAAASGAPACILDAQGSFLYVNDAWTRLEVERGAGALPAVGARFLLHVDGNDARLAWQDALGEVMAGRTAVRVIAGECNTPAVARLVSTRIEPVSGPSGVMGLKLVRNVVRERPIEELYVVSERPEECYRDARGDIALCSCCRRARDAHDPGRWEIVPRWVAAPPVGALELVCDLCAELHLGIAREGCSEAA